MNAKKDDDVIVKGSLVGGQKMPKPTPPSQKPNDKK